MPDTEQACFANGQNGTRIVCDPRYCAPLPNTLYRNNGNGTFTDVSSRTGIAAHLGRGMGVAIADFDGDGFPDIFVANDNAANQLFHNLHGERFEEVAMDAGVALGEDGNVLSGMGADFREVRNTGLPDIWMTAIEKQTFPLYWNLGQGEFAVKTSGRRTGDRYLRNVRLGQWHRGFRQRWLEGSVCGARECRRERASVFAAHVSRNQTPCFAISTTANSRTSAPPPGRISRSPRGHRGVAFGDLDNDGRTWMRWLRY